MTINLIFFFLLHQLSFNFMCTSCGCYIRCLFTNSVSCVTMVEREFTHSCCFMCPVGSFYFGHSHNVSYHRKRDGMCLQQTNTHTYPHMHTHIHALNACNIRQLHQINRKLGSLVTFAFTSQQIVLSDSWGINFNIIIGLSI